MQNSDRLSGHSAFSTAPRKFHAGDAVILTLFSVFAIVSLGMLGSSISLISDPWRKRAWIETPGQMLKCEAVHKARGATRAEVLYRYEFEGQEYRSDRTNFGMALGKTQQRFVESHPAGSAVTVFLNPADPSAAVLTREPSGGWMLLPMAVASMLPSLWFLRAWLRTRHRNGRRQTWKRAFGSPYHRSRSRRRRA